jgi:hypothetical protein
VAAGAYFAGILEGTMRFRELRIVPVEPAAAPSVTVAVTLPAPAAAGMSRYKILKDPDLTDSQFAIFLLQTAADIEHSLLVQYLYAAYSLRPGLKVPGAKDPKTGQDLTTTDWARQIAGIAREEMGHLLSVQLLLRALGGPLSFEREHFPYRSQLYPFPLEVEPLTKASLAKYVYAEMPAEIDDKIVPPDERREISERATTSSGGVGLNHVGLLYDTIAAVLDNLPDSAFRPELTAWQPELSDWSATSVNEDDDLKGVKILPIRVRADGGPAPTVKKVAQRAVKIIARQGEAVTPQTMAGGPGIAAMTAAQLADSHFWRFLQIYRQYPDAFFPAQPIARNPNTTDPPHDLPTDPAGLLREERLRHGRITNPTTRTWALLFNVRYRILLAYQAHYTALPSKLADPKKDKQLQDVRGTLVSWILDEMNGRVSSSLKGLASKLNSLDQHRNPGPKAGPPFEPPFTFALPDLGPDRWRLQQELYLASKGLVAAIPGHEADPILKELSEYEDGTPGNDGRKKYIEDHLNSSY